MNSKRVSFDSPLVWELGGESVIHCEVSPDPPEGGQEATIRLTHSNSYGPVDDVRFSIRLGDLQNPTGFQDGDAATDWQPMQLVEEIVWLDGQERHRSDVAGQLDPMDEIVWAGTFESALTFPAGTQRIEIRVDSGGPLQSGVISDWTVDVR